MCYTETYAKLCSCRNEAPGISRCLDAMSSYLPHCGQVQTRTHQDTTPCAHHPSRGCPRSRSQSGGAFGGRVGASSSRDRRRESSRSRSRPREEISICHFQPHDHGQAGRGHFRPIDEHGRPSDDRERVGRYQYISSHGASFGPTPYGMSEHSSAPHDPNSWAPYRTPHMSIRYYEPHGSTSLTARYDVQPSQAGNYMGRSQQGGQQGSSRNHSSSRPRSSSRVHRSSRYDEDGDEDVYGGGGSGSGPRFF
jgi:hypothetical protein